MNRKIFSICKEIYNYHSYFMSSNNTIKLNVHNCYVNAKLSYPTIVKCVRYYNSSHNHNIATYEEVKEVGSGKDKNILIIDVREPEELSETGVLPSSINIPLQNLENVLKHLSEEEFLKIYGRVKPDKNSYIIFSCKSGKRSAEACDISLKMGLKNVKNYLGGWLDWDERNRNN